MIKKILRWINTTPTWKDLSGLGRSKLIKSSYVWIVVIPIFAKSYPAIEELVSNHGFTVSLSLPFSWHLFYFSAIFFSIGSFIFGLKCSHIIKNFDTPIEFKNEGRGKKQLFNYMASTTKNASTKELKPLKKALGCEHENYKIHNNNEDQFNTLFWALHKFTKHKKESYRALCSFFYFIGLGFLGLVLFQNFTYVLNEFINNYL